MTTLVATWARDMLAAVTAFQTFVGAADATAALAYIHVAGVDAGYTRPCAILGTASDLAALRYASGSHDFFDTPGRVIVLLEGEDVDDDDLENSRLTFTNHVGAILSGLEALSGQGYPVLRGWTMGEDMAPMRAHEDDPEDFWYAAVALDRGLS